MRSAFWLAPILWLAGPALAQPASDLLQAGIYNQDTRGDLDGAIRIYRQILTSGDQRMYTAQAQYRIGACLLRKGDLAGATQAFQAVIREYPDQRELVARARELLPPASGLLPAPWDKAEVAEYGWTIPGAVDVWSIHRISLQSDASRRIRVQTSFYGTNLSTIWAELEPDSMRPLAVRYRGPLTRNSDTGIEVVQDQVNWPQGTYAYGEVLYLLRRLPLGPGWTSRIPVVTPERARIMLGASVVATEEVLVPAGKFKCYKVQLSAAPRPNPSAGWLVSGSPDTLWYALVSGAGGTLWYGVDGTRPLVKIESGKARGELASLRRMDQFASSSYRDPDTGLSFKVPAGWAFHARASYHGPGTSVDLFDPEAQASVIISAKSKMTAPNRIEAELHAGNEARRQITLARWPDSTVRTIETSALSDGKKTLTTILDFTMGGRSQVEWVTYVQSVSTRASITFMVDTADFDRFRTRFQPILDSLHLP